MKLHNFDYFKQENIPYNGLIDATFVQSIAFYVQYAHHEYRLGNKPTCVHLIGIPHNGNGERVMLGEYTLPLRSSLKGHNITERERLGRSFAHIRRRVINEELPLEDVLKTLPEF